MDFFFERFLKGTTAKDWMTFYQQRLRSILKTHTVDPITHIKENCPAPSSSSYASTSTDPPPEKVKNLCDDGQCDKPCPEYSSSPLVSTSTDLLSPSNKVKSHTDWPIQIPRQGDTLCTAHYSSSSLVSTTTDHPTPFHEVKNLCNRALQILNQGNPIKAHHILNNVRNQYKSSSIFHYTHSVVLTSYIVTLINDHEDRKSKIQDAIDSAYQTTTLAPNDLDFSFKYVRMLAADCKLEEAAKESERALLILDHIHCLTEHYGGKNGHRNLCR